MTHRIGSREKLELLLERKDVEILNPEAIVIGHEVDTGQIGSGVIIGPGTMIAGSKTMIGSGTRIVGSATIKNCMIGRHCTLSPGEYVDSVLLDKCSTVGWARIRGNSAWEEGSRCAHNCDTKTTILGYKTTLGSLINFCNVLMLGGTSDRLKVGAEVGSGVINFNFLPFGPSVGVTIKPSTVVGSIESPFLACLNAPVRYNFIGGHTSIIAPVVMGMDSMVAAKTRVNPGIYEDGVLIAGGNQEKPTVVPVSRIRILKDIRPKYRSLIRQLATAFSFQKWFQLRNEWSLQMGRDDHETRLIAGFATKIDHFIEALESYGDSMALYLLASKEHSRPEALEINESVAQLWQSEIKLEFRRARENILEEKHGTVELRTLLAEVGKEVSSASSSFYEVLSKIDYSHPTLQKAREYFHQIADDLVESAKL